MKKRLSFVLALILLFTTFSFIPNSVNAAFPSPSAIDGYENLCLTYTWNPNRSDNGRHYTKDLLPYVAYYDAKGNITDFFFDSFLFLPCMQLGTSGGRLHYDVDNPSRAIDWIDYINDTFYPNANVNALETAAGQAKDALNAPDKKFGVFLSILYPAKSAGSNFGTLGGRTLNTNNLADRKYAVKWMIDEQLSRYNAAGYNNLDLVGFYWLEEIIQKNAIGDEDIKLIQYAAEYIHSLGLKFIWIPYYRANGYQVWKNLGFDFASMQPNMYWQETKDPERVDNCIYYSNRYGMSVEMEVDYKVFGDVEYYNRYLDYLEGCMNGGAMNSVKTYYQDGKEGVYYNAYTREGSIARSIYDLTYKYAKGTITQEDIDYYRNTEFKIPEDVDWISIGKDYTASRPYYGDGSLGYQDNDGTELTDGVLGTTDYDTDWHAFHASLLDADGRMNITIDLGEVTNNITNFFIQFSNINASGIAMPKDDLKIYVSNDGVNFTFLAQPQFKYEGFSAYIHYITQPLNTRYVKYSFINNTTNFVFCGEAMVGKNGQIGSNAPVVPPENPDDPTNVLINKTYTVSGCGIMESYYANLTDGLAAEMLTNKASTEWFGFYYNSIVPTYEVNAPNGIGHVIFDLGTSQTLNLIRAHLIHDSSWAIGAPAEINIYTSYDGTNWTKSACTVTGTGNTGVGYWTEITGYWSTRYLKIEFVLSDIFAFVNEIEAYNAPNDEIAFGDVNFDNIVNSIDYLLVKRHCFQTYSLNEMQLLNADIDQNNIIDSIDYTLIKRITFSTYVAKYA